MTAKAGGRSITTVIEVERRPATVSFRNHVVPVLTKARLQLRSMPRRRGGKNGFKLTLRGYDPELDYLTLTRQAGRARQQGRSGDQPDAAETDAGRLARRRQALLAALSRVSRAGGLDRVRHAGARGQRSGDDAARVFPASARLAVAAEQPLVVRAHFSDGHAEDVTRWVKFSTNEGAVAAVDQRGAVTVNGPGEAAISAWYLSRLVTARNHVSLPDRVDPAVYARAPRANFIDDLVLAKLAELNIAPSPLSSDAEFIRRAFLDVAGILPTAEEVRPFSRTRRRTSV